MTGLYGWMVVRFCFVVRYFYGETPFEGFQEGNWEISGSGFRNGNRTERQVWEGCFNCCGNVGIKSLAQFTRIQILFLYFIRCRNATNCLFKLFAWIYTGSHSMFSECIHSFADTINQLILAYGIHKSVQVSLFFQKKPVLINK